MHMSASEPFEWIRHVLERIEREIEVLQVQITEVQRVIAELRAREDERDRLMKKQQQMIDIRLRWFSILFPAGLIGIVAAVWQWLRNIKFGHD